jgi:uncharacterized protein (TIGR03437 family)
MSQAHPVLWLLLFGGVASAQQYIVSTVAGGAPPQTPMPGTSASLTLTLSVATDTSGNVYFVASNCIFKLDKSGLLSRVAGNAKPGYSGDGGPASTAQIFPPLLTGLAVDPQGNIFVSDYGRIRRISPTGTITTFAGNGVAGDSGDGGPATFAEFAQPSGLALDSRGDLFIADENRVRMVSQSGIITTVAGNGTPGYSGDGGPATSAQLKYPRGLAVDGQGNLLIADFSNGRVRKVTPDGIITTIAGGGASSTGDGGPATSVALFEPVGVAVDSLGDVFIAEMLANRIREVSTGGTITTIAGTGRAGVSGDGGPAANALIYGPESVAVDGLGNIFISDQSSRIREIAASGIINTVAGGGNLGAAAGGAAAAAQLGMPNAVAVDAEGNLFIADQTANRVWKVSQDGTIGTAAGTGAAGYSGDGGQAASATLSGPMGVAFDRQGDLFISDVGNQRIRRVSPIGLINTVAGNGTYGYSGDGGPATGAQLFDPEGVATDSQGNLYISDVANFRVRKVSPGGVITTVAGNGKLGYSGDGGAATSAELASPGAVAADSQGNLFIADVNNQRVRRVSPDGTIITVAGLGTAGFSGDGGPASSAQLFNPEGVAVDSQGNLYISDTSNFRIRRVSLGGIITTVAGAGRQQYSGDGGPATTAQLPGPQSITVDGQGDIYISDNIAWAVRLLQPTNHSVLIGSVVDAASQLSAPLSPGKIVVLYGAGLGPAALVQNQPISGLYASQLAGTTVYFNGTPAPILYTSATQVAAVVPYEIAGATAQVTVSFQSEISPPITVPMAAAAPSLFTLNQTGGGQAAAVNASDGSVNTATNPVKVGDYVSLFATGEGQTSPAGTDGRIASVAVLPQPDLQVSATVGGLAAPVQYAGAAPDCVAGLMQINVQIPVGVQPGGYVPVILQVGTASTEAGAVWIAVGGQ